MPLIESERFKDITIKATEKGIFGELALVIEGRDSVTGDLRISGKHRQVVPLDDLAKTISTPLGSKTVGELMSGINADIAATNVKLAQERDALASENASLKAAGKQK